MRSSLPGMLKRERKREKGVMQTKRKAHDAAESSARSNFNRIAQCTCSARIDVPRRRDSVSAQRL